MIRYLAIGVAMTCLSSAGGLGLAIAHRQMTQVSGYDVADLGAQFRMVQSDARAVESPVSPALAAIVPEPVFPPGAADARDVAVLMPAPAPPAATAARTLRPMARPAGLVMSGAQLATLIVPPPSAGQVTVSSQDRAVSQSPVAKEANATVVPQTAASRKIGIPRYMMGVFR